MRARPQREHAAGAYFINGQSILSRVTNAAGRPALLLQQKLDDEKLIEQLYLWSLARRPSATCNRI